MPLVLDTGPIVAALDADDADHDRCAELLDSGEDMVVLPTVLVEVEYLLRRVDQVGAWSGFVDEIASGVYRLETLSAPDLVRAAGLAVRYRDLGLGLVDASVVALCERLGERRVATLDRRHFGVVRPRHCTRLEIVPD